MGVMNGFQYRYETALVQFEYRYEPSRFAIRVSTFDSALGATQRPYTCFMFERNYVLSC